jgi:GDP-4-dehydro-6-deoxy-D-mannose reductase
VVTGAAGFAGGHLLDILARDGVHAVAWHRQGGSPQRRVPGISWEAVDLLDRSAVGEAIARARPVFVYHCAGAAHVGESWKGTDATYAVNVRGTYNLMEALRDAGSAARVLLPSSAMVYAASERPLCEDDALVPTSPYGLSKLAQELVADDPDLVTPVSIARSFNHFGPRQDPAFAGSGFARRVAEIEAGQREAVLLVGNLDARRDLTDVRDTVRAYRLILERGTPGRVYNVCSGRAVTIRALLDLMLARSRVPIRVQVDPARYRPNDLPLVLGNPSRLMTELGWAPEIPVEQTADDLLSYWRAQVAA